MAAAQKALRITYQSKSQTTGLTDLKAQIYLNGVAKAVGSSALVLTEVDSTNSPGQYDLLIPAATLTGYGVAAGQYNSITGTIDSVTKPAKAPFRADLTVANEDDTYTLIGTPVNASIALDIAAIQTKLGTPAGATISVDIASVKSDTSAIKADLETGSASLQTILTNIQQLQNASIGNGVGFVLPTMLIPTSGTTVYTVPITINNNDGALIDPTSNVVTVGVKNSAGTDRGAYLSGSSGTPATVAATRSSTGQYSVQVNIPTTAVEEELIFSFSYTIGSSAMVRYGVSQVVVDGGAAGYALQATLLTTQATVNAINSAVTNATYGLSAIQAIIANATYGNAAIQSLLANGTYGLAALQALLANGTYGLQALQSILTNATYGLAALQAQNVATQGSGFTGGTDDLHSLSTFVRANLYSGGRAV